MATDVKVPALGESITEGTLAQWLKKPGEAVAQDEPIASLETDKVSVEVPSPVAGTLSEQMFKEGDTVEVGAIIARIGEGGAAAAPSKPEPKAEEKPAEPKTGEPEATVAGGAVNPAGAGEQVRPRDDSAEAQDAALTLSPAVRRAVLEHHVDPSAIKGSGKDGRITKDDVLAAAKDKDAPSGAPAERSDRQVKAGAQSGSARSLKTRSETNPPTRDSFPGLGSFLPRSTCACARYGN